MVRIAGKQSSDVQLGGTVGGPLKDDPSVAGNFRPPPTETEDDDTKTRDYQLSRFFRLRRCRQPSAFIRAAGACPQTFPKLLSRTFSAEHLHASPMPKLGYCSLLLGYHPVLSNSLLYKPASPEWPERFRQLRTKLKGFKLRRVSALESSVVTSGLQAVRHTEDHGSARHTSACFFGFGIPMGIVSSS